MKTKLRNIIVNNKRYVYWYRDGHGLKLCVSLKEDKRSKVEITFEFSPPEEDKYMFWAFYKIIAYRCNVETTLCIVQPKFIASLITYLSLNHEEFFVKGKTTILDAVELLHFMGYSNLQPMWVKEW